MSTAIVAPIETKNKDLSTSIPDDLTEEMRRIDEEIKQFAFHLFQRRGALPGTDFEDWLTAEALLLKPVAVNVEQDKDSVIVRADVPGFTQKDLKVHIEKDFVKICGKAKQTHKSNNEGMSTSEQSFRKIRTTVDLPANVNAKESSYAVKDGVLTLTLPKEHKSTGKTN